MSPAPASPLFVVGYPRSGTTLLQAVLSAHPDVSLAQDKGVVQGLVSAGVPFDGAIPLADRTRVLLEMADVGLCRRHLGLLDRERIIRFLSAETPLSFPAAYELLLPRGDTVVWGEKSLVNAFYIPQLAAVYPRAAFVHIRRDPRAVLLSHWRKAHAESQPVQPPLDRRAIRFFAMGAMRWRAWLEAARRGRMALGEDRLHELRYESFVAEPAREVARLCDALGIPIDDEMLDPGTRVARSGAIVDGSRAAAHRNVGAPIDPARAEAGGELAPWARELVERELGPAMEEAGYAPGGPAATPDEREAVESELASRRRRFVRDVERETARRLGLPSGDPRVAEYVHGQPARHG